MRKLTTLNKKVFPKDRKYKKVPSHVLPDVELGERRGLGFVACFAGGHLDSDHDDHVEDDKDDHVNDGNDSDGCNFGVDWNLLFFQRDVTICVAI